MVDHELYCSTRTEECENCHRYILVRDLKEHPRVCGLVGVQTQGSAPSGFEDEDAHLQDLRHSGRESGTDDEPVTLPCQSCGLRYPIYERMDHELVCVLRPAAEDSMPPKAKRQRQESAEPPWTRSKCQGRCMKKEPGPPAEEARLPRRPRKTAAGGNAQLPAPTSRGKARKKAAGKRGRARKRGACERAGASPSPQRPAKCSRSEPFTSGPSRYSPSQPSTSSEGESSLRTQHTGCSMQLQAPDPELMTRSQAASQPQGNGPSN